MDKKFNFIEAHLKQYPELITREVVDKSLEIQKKRSKNYLKLLADLLKIPNQMRSYTSQLRSLVFEMIYIIRRGVIVKDMMFEEGVWVRHKKRGWIGVIKMITCQFLIVVQGPETARQYSPSDFEVFC